MNPPVTSDEQFPLRTQVNVTGEDVMTLAEVSEAWHNFHPRYSNFINILVPGDEDGRFTTGDGRTGQFFTKNEMGEAVNSLDWTGNNVSEMGGYIDMWKREDTRLLHPVKKRAEYSIVGGRGFEITEQRTFFNGQPYVKTYIRPIRVSQGPTITADTYQKATLIGIPVILHPQQDTMTYDPTRGGTTGRNTRAPTVAFTQEGITGKVAKYTFGFGSYGVGEGDQKRSVAWENYTVNDEPLTEICTHYVLGNGEMREIELPTGSRPEMLEFEGEPNFTGRFLISIDPVNADVA